MIDTVLGHKAYKMDATTKTVTLDDSTEITYQKLLIATGGKPIIPKMEGMGKAGIFNFITLADAIKVEEYLPNVRRAVVIGGGLIGISATEALVKRGIKVTVVEMKTYPLNTILDEPAGRIAEMCDQEIWRQYYDRAHHSQDHGRRQGHRRGL